MSKRYPGNFITGNPVTLSQTSNNGIWDVKDVSTAVGAGNWQEPDGIFEVGGSLRFRGASGSTTYLSRATAAAGDRKAFTVSFWVKRGQLTAAFNEIFSVGNSAGGGDSISFRQTTDSLQFATQGGTQTWLVSTAALRDTTAWYHVVCVYDSAQAVASNRARMYINGQQPVLTTAVYPSQNALSTNYNTTSTHYIGTGYQLHDGYLSEFNFIDGQALDASYFGYTDVTTGIWQPKAYTGIYGTNGFYLPLSKQQQYIPSTYQAAFNGSNQYINVAHTSALAISSGDWTVEMWLRPNSVANTQEFFNKGSGIQLYNNASSAVLNLALSSSNNTTYFGNSSIGTMNVGDWNHVAVSKSGNNYYVSLNGVTTLFITSASVISTGTDPICLGAYYNNSYNANCYISNVRIVSGTALYTLPSYKIPTQALTAIPGTVLLTLQNSTLVDNSGNNNTFTNGNAVPLISTSYVGLLGIDASGTSKAWSSIGFDVNDITVDSPTNVFTSAVDVGCTVAGNYCTLSSVDKAPANILQDGNLVTYYYPYSNSLNEAPVRGTLGVTSGKWYYEFFAGINAGSGNSAYAGITTANGQNHTTTTTMWSVGIPYIGVDASVYNNALSLITNGFSSSVANYTNLWNTYAAGDIVGFAIDLDAGKFWVSKNGSWYNGGNPATGTTPTATFTAPSGTVFPQFEPITSGNNGNRSALTVNFGQRPFSNTPPAGFKTINTTNLQALGTTSVGKAAITPYKWIEASTFGGVSSDITVQNAGFQPDLVWIKARSNAQGHSLVNSVTGGGEILQSNTTGTPLTGVTKPLIFQSNGFTSTTDIHTNGYNYVAWQWKQSPTSGFNIVTYTGDGTSNKAISHNLGTTPTFAIIKSRSNAGGTPSWHIYHKSIAPTSRIYFETAGAAAASGMWGSTAWNSSNFYVGWDGANYGTNYTGSTYLAYLWTEIPGFSSFGSFTGNGNIDGPFAYCGFRPKIVFMKRTSGGTSHWTIWDSTRKQFNVNNTSLYPNLTNAEDAAATDQAIDFLSNGFKVRASSNWETNTSGSNYIYVAFAESPLALNNRAR